MKKYIYLVAALVVVVIVFRVIFLWPKDSQNNEVVNRPGCDNRKYNISLTLQSGEKGIINVTDNQCDSSLARQTNNLSFKLLADGAIEDSIYKSKLYIWSRDNNVSIEKQIKTIADKFNKNKSCKVKKSAYPQHDGLTTYSLELSGKADKDCMLFGPLSDLTSEVFMTTNDLLIVQRQEGIDGIEPFNLGSIKFVVD